MLFISKAKKKIQMKVKVTNKLDKKYLSILQSLVLKVDSDCIVFKIIHLFIFTFCSYNKLVFELLKLYLLINLLYFTWYYVKLLL